MSNSEYRISDNFYDYLTFAFSLRKKNPTKKKNKYLQKFYLAELS